MTSSPITANQPYPSWFGFWVLSTVLFLTLSLVFTAASAQASPAGHGAETPVERPVPVAENGTQIKEKTMDGTQAGDHDPAMAEEETKEHPHWGTSPDSTPFSKVAAYFGKFHPLLVHFPIALFLTAALAQALLLVGRAPNLGITVRFLVWLGTASIIVAALMGWGHAGPPNPTEEAVMITHRWLGTTMVIGAFLTSWLMERALSKGNASSDFLFNASLFAMALAVALNGFLGGALAHGGLKHLLPGLA